MKFLLAAVLVAMVTLPAGCGQTRIIGDASQAGSAGQKILPTLAGSPPVILWAWQRPNDLRFINPCCVGVSYLVETIHLAAEGFTVEPNQDALELPAGTWLMACARIEGMVSPASHVSALATELARLARFPNAKAVQIDFDAVLSQRAFYRQLLGELRHRLRPSIPLSITALASWCEGDDWISQLPVTEAVPMLFRMGPDRDSILLSLNAGDDFSEPICRQSAGISTDEVLPHLRAGRRLYIFDPSGWTKGSFGKIIAEMKR